MVGSANRAVTPFASWPGLGEQLYNLAVAFRGIGKDEEALRALQTAVRDFPRAKTAPQAVQLLEQMGQLDSVDP